LTLTFDGFPNDISWVLAEGEGEGEVLAGGSGYSDTLRGQEVVLDKVCVPTNACYTFVIRDSQGDGLCCNMGEGNYKIDIDDGMDGFEGGIFSFRESMQFCVGEST
jgi:trimeric autotransporter adhesin